MFFATGYAQKGKLRKANQEYEDYAYVRTSEILKEVAEKGYTSVDLLQKLGNSYYFNNDMVNAAKWYGELVMMDGEIDPEYYFRYALALKGVENYKESDFWMQKFHENQRDDLRGQAFVSNVDYLSKIEASSQDVQIKNLLINTEVSDFGAMEYNDQLIFASSRGEGKKYKWNDQSFLEIYAATKDNNDNYGGVKKFNEHINKRFHESSVAFSKNQEYVFFTRNNYVKNRFKKDKAGIVRLKLYRAKSSSKGGWEKEEMVHFNSDSYSVAHPTINTKGNKLYFASDMPDTNGLSDIYMVTIDENGDLGVPENLGKLINTEGQETFPFISATGDLFFASNGYSGLGGLDIYVVRDFENKKEKGLTLEVENIGRPFNSPQDDFAYYENITTESGFFTSNRPGGIGDDDIYSFKFPKCDQNINGIVVDKDTQEIISNAKVSLFTKDGTLLDDLLVEDNALFAFSNLDCESEYIVRGEKKGYTADEKRFTTPSKPQELNIKLELKRDEYQVNIGDDLAKVLDIPIIYFDFDKSTIRTDAAIELQKVIAVMRKYPQMKIDVRSHTDCRASYAYNDALSSRRNTATIKYLIEVGGITADRLTGRGYGERQLVNDCACEGDQRVYCSEEDHQLNRRSEFIVVSTK